MKHDAPVDIKQRVVGAIVIISLAIIILPIFLSSRDNSLKTENIDKVPVIPQDFQNTFTEYDKKSMQVEPIPALPLPEAIPVDEINIGKMDSSKQDSAKQVIRTGSSSVYKNAIKPENKRINQAYTIQLGSFSQKENALQLRKKLQSKKYKAYIEKIYLANGDTYRVRVGPFLKYDQVVLIQRKIKRQIKIDGKIVNYK